MRFRPAYSDTRRGYDVYTPHRSIVYHDYNHGPDTSVTSSWSRKSQELQVRHIDRTRKGEGGSWKDWGPKKKRSLHKIRRSPLIFHSLSIVPPFPSAPGAG